MGRGDPCLNEVCMTITGRSRNEVDRGVIHDVDVITESGNSIQVTITGGPDTLDVVVLEGDVIAVEVRTVLRVGVDTVVLNDDVVGIDVNATTRESATIIDSWHKCSARSRDAHGTTVRGVQFYVRRGSRGSDTSDTESLTSGSGSGITRTRSPVDGRRSGEDSPRSTRPGENTPLLRGKSIAVKRDRSGTGEGTGRKDRRIGTGIDGGSGRAGRGRGVAGRGRPGTAHRRLGVPVLQLSNFNLDDRSVGIEGRISRLIRLVITAALCIPTSTGSREVSGSGMSGSAGNRSEVSRVVDRRRAIIDTGLEVELLSDGEVGVKGSYPSTVIVQVKTGTTAIILRTNHDGVVTGIVHLLNTDTPLVNTQAGNTIDAFNPMIPVFGIEGHLGNAIALVLTQLITSIDGTR